MSEKQAVIQCVTLVDLSSMDIEDLFAFIITSSAFMELQSPMPFSQSSAAIAEATGRIIRKLQEKGIVSEEKVLELAIKLSDKGMADAKQAVSESNIEEVIEQIGKQSETAKQN